VDDDPGVREGLGRLLRAEGLRVRLCSSVDEMTRRNP